MTFKDLLDKNNLTTYTLSKKSDVPFSTVFDLSSGKSDIGKTSVNTIKRIANSLDLSVDEFLNEFDDEIIINIVLMNKNKKVLKAKYNKNYHSVEEIIEIYNIEYAPLHLANVYKDKSSSLKKAFNEWFKGRGIPSWRKDLENLLEKLNVKSSEELLDKAYGLSLSDQYWIKEEKNNIKWKDINFFDNDFRYEGYLNVSIDSSSLRKTKQADLKSPNNTTDGMLQKGWIIEKGKRVLVKGTYTANREEPFNEWLASRICERLGFYYCPYRLDFVNKIFVSKCDNFINDNEEIITAYDIYKSEKKPNNINDYEFYINILEKNGIKDARKYVAQMFLVDYLIMNTDRHLKNFGIIRNVNTLKWVRTTPIFDSGESMECDKYTYDMNFNNGTGKFFLNGNKDFEAIFKSIKKDINIEINKLDGLTDEYKTVLLDYQKRLEISDNRIETLVAGLKSRIDKLRKNLNK